MTPCLCGLLMKIEIAKLQENKTENFQESIDSVALDLDTNDIKYKDKINISTKARREMQVLYTKTHLSSQAEFTCSRCLKKYDYTIERDFDIKYPLDKNEQFIDITNDIREEMILSYPVKFLCKSDCKGLCLQCGKNFNEGPCDCTEQNKEQ